MLSDLETTTRPKNLGASSEIHHFEMLLFSYDMLRLKAFERAAPVHEAKDTDSLKLYLLHPIFISPATSQIIAQAIQSGTYQPRVSPLDIIVDDSHPDESHLDWKHRKVVNYFKRREIYHVILNLLEPIKVISAPAHLELQNLSRSISYHASFSVDLCEPNSFLDVVRVDAIYQK